MGQTRCKEVLSWNPVFKILVLTCHYVTACHLFCWLFCDSLPAALVKMLTWIYLKLKKPFISDVFCKTKNAFCIKMKIFVSWAAYRIIWSLSISLQGLYIIKYEYFYRLFWSIFFWMNNTLYLWGLILQFCVFLCFQLTWMILRSAISWRMRKMPPVTSLVSPWRTMVSPKKSALENKCTNFLDFLMI